MGQTRTRPEELLVDGRDSPIVRTFVDAWSLFNADLRVVSPDIAPTRSGLALRRSTEGRHCTTDCTPHGLDRRGTDDPRQKRELGVPACWESTVTHVPRKDLWNLEAPPGFEPGIEVLQTGPESLTCCLVLLPGRPSPLVFRGVRARLFPDCSQVRPRSDLSCALRRG
jgi:hypothetical protein